MWKKGLSQSVAGVAVAAAAASICTCAELLIVTHLVSSSATRRGVFLFLSCRWGNPALDKLAHFGQGHTVSVVEPGFTARQSVLRLGALTHRTILGTEPLGRGRGAEPPRNEAPRVLCVCPRLVPLLTSVAWGELLVEPQLRFVCFLREKSLQNANHFVSRLSRIISFCCAGGSTVTPHVGIDVFIFYLSLVIALKGELFEELGNWDPEGLNRKVI